jgi:hypothetical protein
MPLSQNLPGISYWERENEMTEPFLFDELSDNSDSKEEEKQVYTSPIEQATLDVMEEVDLFFRASVTVEEYDTVQKKVKKILLDAFEPKQEEKKHCLMKSHE